MRCELVHCFQPTCFTVLVPHLSASGLLELIQDMAELVLCAFNLCDLRWSLIE